MPLPLRNKKVLVTGCAGFIPSYVTEGLLQKGAYVYGVDDLSTGALENMHSFAQHSHFEFIQKNIDQKKLIATLIPKVDYVYHGAVRGVGISTQSPLKELAVNVHSTLLILEAVRKFGIKRFIFPSSASVYGNPTKIPENENDLTLPLSPYGVTKLAAERYCLAYHRLFEIPLVCLRYFNTYGPRQNKDSIYGGVISIFVDRALKNQPLYIYGNGRQTRDFTYITDNLAATLRAFTAPRVLGQVINIATGREYRIQNLAQKVKQISRNPKLAIKYTPARLVDNIQRRCGNIRLARKLLGYKPHVSLQSGLQKTFLWYQKRNVQ